MNKYLFVVYGPSADNAEDRAMGMAEMAAWYGSLGSALIDPGRRSPLRRPSPRGE